MAKKTVSTPIAVKKRDHAAAGPAASADMLSSDFSSTFKRVYHNYLAHQTPRSRLIDGFMALMLVLGIVQFVFCLLVGAFPFNAFLGGFSSCVGQFVLLASLRIQTNRANAHEFSTISPERAFGEFVFGSLLLHFMVYHFIN